MPSLTAGRRAPEFALKGIDELDYALRHSGNDPTLLAFFKNTCPTCMLLLPFLQRLYERVESAPLRFWGISQDGPLETTKFGAEYGVTFPLLPDDRGYPVSNSYGLTSVPTLFLVEPGGSIVWTSVGFVKADLEGLAIEFARRFRFPGTAPLFSPADDVPTLKPG